MATPEHEDNLAMSVYIVDYHYDSEKLSLKCQTRPQHRAFMRHLNALGTVLSTGRTADLPDKGSIQLCWHAPRKRLKRFYMMTPIFKLA